jgi:hypothetical protein
MYHCIPMAYGKIQIQTLTHGYQDCLVPDVFQNVISKLVQGMEYFKAYLDDLIILTNRKKQLQILSPLIRNISSKTLNRWYESEHFQI